MSLLIRGRNGIVAHGGDDECDEAHEREDRGAQRDSAEHVGEVVHPQDDPRERHHPTATNATVTARSVAPAAAARTSTTAHATRPTA